MTGTMTEISVAFEGDGAGEGELTWGQRKIWLTTQRTGRTMNLVVLIPLPGGTSLASVAAELRFLVSRHPAMRTRLRFTGGPAGPRPVRQVIAGSGAVPLQVVDIGEHDDAAAAAEQVRARYELTWFDYAREFPIRMGVIRRAGTLTHLVVGYGHVMVDGGAMVAMARDLAYLDPVTGAATAPPRGLSPLELARVQSGPAGHRQNERCMRYWAAQLARLPSWQGCQPAEPREPRFWELVAYSPAMELAFRAIAARIKTDTTYVLLAAFAVAVARVLGRDPGVAMIVVNNRFRPGFADTVSHLSQEGLCVIDVAGATFDEVVDQARTEATNASYYGYYDLVRLDQLIEETTARLGRPLDIFWQLNDRRGLLGVPDDQEPPTGARLTAALAGALPRTVLRWDRTIPMFDAPLFIHVDSSPDLSVPGRWAGADERPAVFLEIWVDTHKFALAQIENLVREMEATVVAAALDPAAPEPAAPDPVAAGSGLTAPAGHAREH